MLCNIGETYKFHLLISNKVQVNNNDYSYLTLTINHNLNDLILDFILTYNKLQSFPTVAVES